MAILGTRLDELNEKSFLDESLLCVVGRSRGLGMKRNMLIKAIEEAVREMDQNGYSPEVRRRLLEAVVKARPKSKD
ncbi:hypothetical protein ES708_17954 [subsurface metagenome]